MRTVCIVKHSLYGHHRHHTFVCNYPLSAVPVCHAGYLQTVARAAANCCRYSCRDGVVINVWFRSELDLEVRMCKEAVAMELGSKSMIEAVCMADSNDDES